MNLNRLLRYLLLLLFALLQCLAPLAHAHVNGDNTSHGVHVEFNVVPWAGDHDHASVHQPHGEPHSAVVCMPPEFRGSALLVEQAVATNNAGMPVQPEHSVLVADGWQSPCFAHPPYRHPFAQAPPFLHA